VALSVVLSLLHGVYIVARPESEEFVRIPGTTVWRPQSQFEGGERLADVLVFGPGVPVYFSNARAIRNRLLKLLDARPAVKLVVLEGSGVIDLDFTGGSVLRQTVGELQQRGVAVVAARVTAERAAVALARSGLTRQLGPNAIVPSVDEAIRAWRGAAGVS
jgi:MFS superfamily sulfate permease-like transporter